ncbi:PR domain zinc finger protein 5-like isoform X2 [Toxorhynchites rutilus septentrionalis]|uniref:PR domain zinc finger protein 5-like isoform X2 n=1 Tax=Toxorhynchites rutilus septentrionalis TaxID=329112 RepID=UPI0024785E4E|nr:PR domain zinc finger protein 5-like isoform X2 [Toxorhynchites rutilus septentrionalis]
MFQNVSHYFPAEVCCMCLEVFDFFYKYKQKIKNIHRFLVAFVEVKLGNKRPLIELFDEHNDYFSILFKDLDLCNADELHVEDMLEEYQHYKISSMPDLVKQETVVVQSEPEAQDDYEAEFLEEKDKCSSLFSVETLIEDLSGTKNDTGKVVEIKAEPVSLIPVSLKESQAGVEEVPYESDHLEDFTDAFSGDSNDDERHSLEVQKEQNRLLGEQVPVSKTSHNCSKCKFRTNFEEAFKAHQRRHQRYDHLEGKHCIHPSCLKVFPDEDTFQKHLKTGIHKEHICDICGVSLKHKYSLEVHLARHSGVTQFDCQYCSSSFYTKTELRNHVRYIHTTGEKCECSTCGAVFKNNKLLKQHLESHVQERNFKCSACDFAFKTQQHLKRHVATVHQEVRFHCQHCEITYGRKDKLRMHMERAHNIQSYFNCDICLRSFDSAAALEEHKGHHANPKRHECAICLIAFENEAAFEEHMCITYREDYICCERDFKFHVHYNRHMLMSHGIKSNARVKPKSGLLVGQQRAGRRHIIRCRVCKVTFGSMAEKKQHIASCGKTIDVLLPNLAKVEPMQLGENVVEEHLEEGQDCEDMDMGGEEVEYVISEEVEEEIYLNC